MPDAVPVVSLRRHGGPLRRSAGDLGTLEPGSARTANRVRAPHGGGGSRGRRASAPRVPHELTRPPARAGVYSRCASFPAQTGESFTWTAPRKPFSSAFGFSLPQD